MGMRIIDQATGEEVATFGVFCSVVFDLPAGRIEVAESSEWPTCVRVSSSHSLQDSIRVRPVAGNVIEVEPFQK